MNTQGQKQAKRLVGMKKVFVASMIFSLTGCSLWSSPLVQDRQVPIPRPDDSLMSDCERELADAKDRSRSATLDAAVETKGYLVECADKVDGWQRYYQEQIRPISKPQED